MVWILPWGLETVQRTGAQALYSEGQGLIPALQGHLCMWLGMTLEQTGLAPEQCLGVVQKFILNCFPGPEQ